MTNSKLQPFFKIPSFLYPIYNIEKMNTIKKLFLLIYGKIIQIFYKSTNGRVFCFFINLLIPKYSNINFKNEFYYKKLNSEIFIFYPNKRITRVIQKKEELFNNFFDDYCLNEIKFSDDDVIVDCGANIGELNFSFFFKGFNINYFGIEPDPKVFECLTLNKISKKESLFNCALSDEVGSKNLYLDTEGANTSLTYFGSGKKEIIKVMTLDTLDIPEKIKLFKLEAEGHEKEVLLGSLNTLKNIEYISVDFGPEKGVKEDHTMIDVNELLIQNNFKLINFKNHRMIGLYSNKKFLKF